MFVAAGSAKAAEAVLSITTGASRACTRPRRCLELSTALRFSDTTTFGGEPNTQVLSVCLGLPGSLPVLNRAAVESAIPHRAG